MIKRLVAVVLLAVSLLSVSSCSAVKDSSFSITFLDVGQGDAALVECDGLYMLIDGGDVNAGKTVYDFLVEHEIHKLEILAISHLHRDHYGGLIKALTYAQDVDITLSNKLYSDSDKTNFAKFEHILSNIGASITVPAIGDTYALGSATVEVLDVKAEQGNDSLVLLITYGKTSFLFAGDMELGQESCLCERYNDNIGNIDLLKVGHHGSKTSTSIRFLTMLMPKYAIISVGKGHQPDHPSQQTLDRFEQADVQVFRTDVGGNIVAESNGREISVKYMS